MKNNNLKLKTFTFLIVILSFSFFVFSFSFARGYPIENAGNLNGFSNLSLNQAGRFGNSVNEMIKSLFGPGFSSFSSVKVDESFSTGLSFNDFINIKSFSANDISGSVKAVAILFLKLVILTLSITLSIFKMILSLATNIF